MDSPAATGSGAMGIAPAPTPMDQGPAKSTSSPTSVAETREEKKEELIAEARAMVSGMLEAIDKDNSPTDSSLAYSRNPLKVFSTTTAVSVEKFISSGGLRSIVVVVKKHAASGQVVDFACKALGAFTIIDHGSVSEMTKSGAIDSVVCALKAQKGSDHESACVSLLKTLRNLTQSSESRKTIFESGGIEAIVETMNARPWDSRCNSHAALVLSNLAFGNQEIKEAVGTGGGLEAIATSMRSHGDYQPMQARGSLALRNLCYNSDPNQAIAGDHGAVEALLEAIKGYMDDREVVHQSCIALTNMSNLSEKNRTRIVDANGAKTVLDLMKKYKQSATVNDDSISIIRNICVNHTSAQVEIGRHGGVADIISAMRMFRRDIRMIEKATAALRYLCFTEENRAKVGECGGMETIVDALKTTIAKDSAVENSLLAIGNATFESPDNKAIVGRCGGIQTIVEAVEQHRLSETIQEHGCRVLRNLADGFEFNRRLQIEGGAINTAVFAMMGYPDNAAVQEQGLAMLLNLAMSDSCLDTLHAADVERLAEKALNRHAKNRGVALQGGQLLDRMHGYDDPLSPKNVPGSADGASRFGLFRRKK